MNNEPYAMLPDPPAPGHPPLPVIAALQAALAAECRNHGCRVPATVSRRLLWTLLVEHGDEQRTFHLGGESAGEAIDLSLELVAWLSAIHALDAPHGADDAG